MPVPFPNFPEAGVVPLGKGYVLIGSFFEAGGLTFLGPTEGDITFNPGIGDGQSLTFPESSEDAVWDRKYYGANPTVEVPLLTGVRGKYEELYHLADKGVVVIPEREYEGGIQYDPTAPTPQWENADGSVKTAPEFAIWIPRAKLPPPASVFGFSERGKRTASVTIQGMPYPDLEVRAASGFDPAEHFKDGKDWDPEAGVYARHFHVGDPTEVYANVAI